jgi:hypothetical protein
MRSITRAFLFAVALGAAFTARADGDDVSVVDRESTPPANMQGTGSATPDAPAPADVQGSGSAAPGAPAPGDVQGGSATPAAPAPDADDSAGAKDDSGA